MPVQPVPKDPEDMEVEADSAAEANGEEEEEEESEEDQSGSESETEDESSEMDDEDCERRRTECLDEMSDLEKQFTDIKETLFKERVNQVKTQLEEVISGEAADYLKPLAVLQKNMKVRTKVAGVYKELCLKVIQNKYACELQGARQHLESEKLLLHDNIRSSILERIQRLEDDRQSVNITSEWWNDEVGSKKNKKKLDLFKSERKKKPILVSGPYIVYLLRDIDILEDWTAIKKAKAAVSPQKRKSEGSVKTEKHQYSAKCEDGRLYYEGECFTKGQTIVLEMKDELPSQ
nr:PREDICTED: breast cancer metastasis-suppressor 1 [Latimeria chalumnae]|eukprot:XP_014347788.1 PREDICTED: breast cancer metastasis-suppressor 1 [Latimeria chalumnae]